MGCSPSMTAEAEAVPQVTHQVIFHISIDDDEIGSIMIGLFGTVVPKTTQNFFTLSELPRGEGYVGSKFHRVIPNFVIQGGDFTNGDGTGGHSIYGKKFNDENFKLHHYGAGWVSMANSGKNTNGSQFFITTAQTSSLDGKHVVFGKVLEGMDVVRIIENVATDSDNRPFEDVVICETSTVIVDVPFNVSKDDADRTSVDRAISKRNLLGPNPNISDK